MIITQVVEGFTIATVSKIIFALAQSIIKLISGNELLFVLFCASFVSLACVVVRKIKTTAK